MTLLERVRVYPGRTGIMSSILSASSGLINVITNEQVIKALSFFGGAFGLLVAVASLYHKWIQIKIDRKKLAKGE